MYLWRAVWFWRSGIPSFVWRPSQCGPVEKISGSDRPLELSPQLFHRGYDSPLSQPQHYEQAGKLYLDPPFPRWRSRKPLFVERTVQILPHGRTDSHNRGPRLCRETPLFWRGKSLSALPAPGSQCCGKFSLLFAQGQPLYRRGSPSAGSLPDPPRWARRRK